MYRQENLLLFLCPFNPKQTPISNIGKQYRNPYKSVGDKPTARPKLNWTGSKTALTELIYALHSQGIFNSGNADIKPIVKVFESTFNIYLGDFYHTFLELKSRKINRTKFLDSLKETLIRKMDEQDGR